MYRTPTPNPYREAAVLTATPAQLVVMLYDGAIRFLKQAEVLMREQAPVPEVHGRLKRAEAIIEELLTTLDLERGDKIAEKLQAIYLFAFRELGFARLERDPDKIAAVARLLADLREGWATIAGQQG